MSREIFEIVQGMDLKNIETQLALQCAPLITGLKISNMLIVSNEDEKLVRAILKRTGISCYRLLQNEKRSRFFFVPQKSIGEIFGERGCKRGTPRRRVCRNPAWKNPQYFSDALSGIYEWFKNISA